MATEKLYLDDLSVGDSFESRPYKITKEEIITFAEKFDRQSFHLDEVAAEKSMFNGLIAPGWNTGGILMRLMVESVPFAFGIIGAGIDKMDLPLPTRPDDILTAHSVIRKIKPSRSKPNQGMIWLETTLVNQHEETVAVATCKLLDFKREK